MKGLIIVNNKRLAINIILICNAIVLSYLETFIPMLIPVPGAKIGLANIITIVAIVFLNYKDVIFIVVFRCLAIAILSKGIAALVFSLTAGILSASVMWILYKKAKGIFSVKGMSIIGAIVHNITQIIVASVIIRENIILYYLPILLITAIIAGFIIGYVGDITVKEIKRKGIL